MHDLDRVQLEFDPDERAEQLAPVAGPTEFEDELAAELLTVTDEDQLDQFVGRLVKGAAQVAGRAMRSDVGRAVTGTVKDAVVGAAQRALPQLGRVLGGAIGTRVGYGTVGSTIGERLATSALRRIGVGELEAAVADDDVQFEVAREIVRFAKDTAQTAARTQGGANARQVAVTAAVAAARRASRQARPPATATTARRSSGRWTRKGHTIILTQV